MPASLEVLAGFRIFNQKKTFQNESNHTFDRNFFRNFCHSCRKSVDDLAVMRQEMGFTK